MGGREGGRERRKGDVPLSLLGESLGFLLLGVLLLLHKLLQLLFPGGGIHVLHLVYLVGETHLEGGREGGRGA